METERRDVMHSPDGEGKTLWIVGTDLSPSRRRAKTLTGLTPYSTRWCCRGRATAPHPPPRGRELLRAGGRVRVPGGGPLDKGRPRLVRPRAQRRPAHPQERGQRGRPSADARRPGGSEHLLRGNWRARNGYLFTPRIARHRKVTGDRSEVRSRNTTSTQRVEPKLNRTELRQEAPPCPPPRRRAPRRSPD